MDTTWDFYRSHVVFFSCRKLFLALNVQYRNLFLKSFGAMLFIAIFACPLCGKVDQYFI